MNEIIIMTSSSSGQKTIKLMDSSNGQWRVHQVHESERGHKVSKIINSRTHEIDEFIKT